MERRRISSSEVSSVDRSRSAGFWAWFVSRSRKMRVRVPNIGSAELTFGSGSRERRRGGKVSFQFGVPSARREGVDLSAK